MKFRAIYLALVLLASASAQVTAQEVATVSVKAGTAVNSFIPLNVFGTNVASWADPRPVQKKVQEAGNFLLRFPGGSWGDVYHWNGAGSTDKEGRWVPDNTAYKPGHLVAKYQPNYSSAKAVDGEKTTEWRSSPDTDYPHFQWLILDFGNPQSADAVTVTWGAVTPGKWTVQYWDPAASRQWMPYSAADDAWMETSARRNIVGKAGTQGVTFTPVKTRYLRLVMKESSSAAGGGYSVAEAKGYNSGKAIPFGDMRAVASSTHQASTLEEKALDFHFESFMEFVNSFAPKAVPLMIVNFGTGTPQEAAAWVHYANKVKGYGIKYWELGNEMEAHWEGGGPANARDYAKRFILFYEAMKAEDPAILVLGTANGPESSSGLYDGQSYIQSFVNRLNLEGKGRYLEGLTLHEYPQWGQKAQDLLDNVPSHLASMAATVTAQLSAHPIGTTLPLFLTEFNTSDHVVPDISVRLENGIWLAQYLCETIRQFGNRAHATLWNIMNGGSAIKEPKGGDHGYLQAEGGPYQYQERADYWTMRMLASYWSVAGDEKTHKMVAAESSQARLVSYGNLRPDGSLALLVVNKDPEKDFKTALSLEGFAASPKARGWKFDSSNYQWSTASLPYHADPDKPPTAFELSGPNFSFTFPKYSITVIQFSPAAQAKP